MIVTAKDAQRFARQWMDVLELQTPPHDLGIRIHQCADHETDESMRDRPAYIVVQDGYQFSNVTINAYLIDNDDDLEWTVLHEVGHIKMGRIATILRQAMPGATAAADAIEHDALNAFCRAIWRAMYGAEPPMKRLPRKPRRRAEKGVG